MSGYRQRALNDVRAEVYGMMLARSTYSDVARVFDVPVSAARTFCRNMGFDAARRRGIPRKLDARDKEIIALRVSGCPYEEIGARFQITRERVRQLLNRAGRSDLTGAFAVAIGLNLGERIEWRCAHCEKVELRTPALAAKGRYCSMRCSDDASSVISRVAPQMLEMRRAGKKWIEIASALDLGDYQPLPNRLKSWARARGIGLDGLIAKTKKHESIAARIPLIRRLRLEGKTWKQIGTLLGYKDPMACYNALRAWGKRPGADISWMRSA